MPELSPQLKQATPVLAERGEGVYLYGEDGRRYLDFTAGIGVTSTGHCHPTVVAAVQEQAARLLHGQYTTVLSRPLRDLTERLGEVLPPGSTRCSSSTAAARPSRRRCGWPGTRPAGPASSSSTGSFHGRTFGAAALTTSGTKFRAGIGPCPPGWRWRRSRPRTGTAGTSRPATDFALRELDYVLATISPASDTAAFFVEPVLGEGGYVPAPAAVPRGPARARRPARHPAGLRRDPDRLRAHRPVLGPRARGVRPDVLVTAKGLASGLPLSAIAAPHALMERAWPGSQGGTYGGNPVACAAALATLRVIQEEGLVANAARDGRPTRTRAAGGRRAAKAIGDVRGLGLMRAASSPRRTAARTPTRLRAQRAAGDTRSPPAHLRAHWNNVVRMIPALVVDESQVDEAVGLWAGAVEAVGRENHD